MENTFNFEPVSIAEAREELDRVQVTTGVFQAPRSKWQRLPLTPQELALTPQAEDWLQALPSHLRPYNCVKYYPRIANKLAKQWERPIFFHEYIVDLVLDKRGGRQGFPHGITLELDRLRVYYETLHPRLVMDIWGVGA